MRGEAVTRRRRTQTGVDEYGDPVYTTVDTLLAERAAFDPGGSREPVEVGRTATVTNPKLYFRKQWPDILTTDLVIVRGGVYHVIGDPADWKSPYGSGMGGLVVELEQGEG